MNQSEENIFLGYLSLPILLRLSKRYTPKSKILIRSGKVDLLLNTDELGRVISFLLGKLDADKQIQGGVFERRLILDEKGKVISAVIEFIRLSP